MKWATLILVYALFFPMLARADDVAKFDKQGDVLLFSGVISKEILPEMRGFLKSGVHTIIVNSLGGDAEAGLLIGQEISKRNIKIIVDKYCLSSCANYWFLSAKEKVISSGAVLGFHGGFYSNMPDLPAYLPRSQGKADVQKLVDEDQHHFESIEFNREFFKLSFTLTKLDRPAQTYIVWSGNSSQKFESEVEFQKYMSGQTSDHKITSIEMNSGGLSSDKFYFPEKKTLENYGAKGLFDYAYPASEAALQKLAEILEKEVGFRIELVGDFNRKAHH